VVLSLRPDVATYHVHFLRTTHALRLGEFGWDGLIIRTVCYHASYLGKARRFMNKDGYAK
jgi:hypothetical protein